ncbi:MAG: universal stress protein [Crocinitomicaceae bacterium]
MIKVILTTNFSESTRNAMNYAVHLFGNENTEYIIMNTYIDSPTGNDGFLSVDELQERGGTKHLRKEEQLLRAAFPDKNLTIRIHSTYGLLASAINDAVKDLKANYVVIGNRSKYNFEAAMLRAKTYELIDKIECPVLAVPVDRKFTPGEGGLIFASDMHRIKYPEQIKPLIGIAKYHKVPVMVINVKKPQEDMTKKEEEAGEQLEDIFSSIPHEFHHLKNEDVKKGIRKFVDAHGRSLLVLLARKQNIFQRFTQQSLTKEMSRLAEMPLLILHDY